MKCRERGGHYGRRWPRKRLQWHERATCAREFGALNDLLDDEDADVLDDLEIFGENDQPRTRSWSGARLVAETTSGAAAVAASAAARLELLRKRSAKGNHEAGFAARATAVQSCALCRLLKIMTPSGNSRDVVCALAVDGAIQLGRLPVSSERDQLLRNALRLPAGRKAAQLVEVVATSTTTDPWHALAAAEDCLNEAATNEMNGAVC